MTEKFQIDNNAYILQQKPESDEFTASVRGRPLASGTEEHCRREIVAHALMYLQGEIELVTQRLNDLKIWQGRLFQYVVTEPFPDWGR